MAALREAMATRRQWRGPLQHLLQRPPSSLRGRTAALCQGMAKRQHPVREWQRGGSGEGLRSTHCTDHSQTLRERNEWQISVRDWQCGCNGKGLCSTHCRDHPQIFEGAL